MDESNGAALVVALLVASSLLVVTDPAGLLGSATEEEHATTDDPADRRAPAEAPRDWGFEDVTEASGFDHVVGASLGEAGSELQRTVVGGLSVGDVDGDGWQDVFVADAGPDKLYRNRGDGTFEDVTEAAGVAGDPDAVTTAGLFLDHDGDGDVDLLTVAFGSATRFYVNRGDGTFEEATGTAGVGRTTWAYAAAAVDVDGDGDLDVSIGNYQDLATEPNFFANATNAERDLLYINQLAETGNATFREEGEARGLTATRWTFSHAWADHDHDGDPDLYLNADFGWDLLYENDGTGNLTDVTQEAGTLTNRNGMGAVWTDVDGDLDLDLFATNIHVPGAEHVPVFRGNNLFIRGPEGRFQDEASTRGVAAGGWGWDSAWEDLDHDGDVDGLQTAGMVTREPPDVYYDADVEITDRFPQSRPGSVVVASPWYDEGRYLKFELSSRDAMNANYSIGGRQPDRLFLNDGAGRFRDAAAGTPFAPWADSRSLALLDVEGDGDLDVVRTAYGRPLQLFRNLASDTATEDDPRHWLRIDLQGRAPNTQAVGAHVIVRAGDLAVLRHAALSGGFLGVEDRPLHVGLGDHAVADEVVVTWPDGGKTRLTDVPADQLIPLEEPNP